MSASPEVRPPVPPFTLETARQKVRAAEDGWNTRDPQRVSLAYTPQTPFIAFHALLVLAAANDPAAIRAISVPDATDEQATTLRLIGEGLIALTEGQPRLALGRCHQRHAAEA